MNKKDYLEAYNRLSSSLVSLKEIKEELLFQGFALTCSYVGDIATDVDYEIDKIETFLSEISKKIKNSNNENEVAGSVIYERNPQGNYEPINVIEENPERIHISTCRNPISFDIPVMPDLASNFSAQTQGVQINPEIPEVQRNYIQDNIQNQNITTFSF